MILHLHNGTGGSHSHLGDPLIPGTPKTPAERGVELPLWRRVPRVGTNRLGHGDKYTFPTP